MTTMTTRRRLLALCAAVVVIPVLFGIGFYVFLKHETVAKYDTCVSSLSEAQRRKVGLDMVVEHLQRVPQLQGLRWNLNAPYDPTAINILIPSQADAAWHASCGLPVAPADCLAAASEKFVICNSVVGAQLSNPLLVSGIGRAEVKRARLFLALAFIGHELGHLKAGAPASVRHLFPQNKANGLACSKADQNAPSEERDADEFGTAMACEAIKASPGDVIGTDANSAVRTMSYLRDRLDEDYFAFDDTCGGDTTYPSMSRRKSTFATVYANCLFPNRDLPYAAVATDQDAAFKRLEAWLRERQRNGIVGSALYGVDDFYGYDVAPSGSAASFVAFDSSGSRAQVSATMFTEKSVEHKVIAAWAQAGALIDQRSDGGLTADFLASFAAANDTHDVRRVTVKCPQDISKCEAKQQVRRIAASTELYGTTAHAIIETTGNRVRTFASSADYLSETAVIDAKVDLDLQGGTVLLDGNASRVLVARQPGDGEVASGFHRVGMLGPKGLQWSTFSTLTSTTSPLAGVGLYGDRVAFVFHPESYQLGGRMRLWVCPTKPFEGDASVNTKVSCDVYGAPENLSFSIGLANNDLSALGTRMMRADFCEGLIVLRRAGWLWLVDPVARTQDTVPGTGLVNCTRDRRQAWLYRMRRIDDVRLEFRQADPSSGSLMMVRTGNDPLARVKARQRWP